MAQNSARNLLTSVDNLFTTQAERDEAQCERVITSSTEQISSFPGHPFHVHIDDKMWEMVDSVKQHGILVPTLVRPKPDGSYQMVAGHRRKLASELAGVPLPCIVRDLTDDEATIIMIDSNLQRENILPSEKAFAYKMKLEAMKRQGVRTDLTSDPLGPKFAGTRSNAELASQTTDSVTQIKRYIRLTYLLPELLTMVDNSVLKDKDTKDNRIVRINEELTRFHQEVLGNLNCVHGALLRMNRSIQAEGAFGGIKWNRGYKRLRRRGIEGVMLELGLICCGFNLHKYHLKKMAAQLAA